jgi:hypothetical protein
MEPVVPQMRDVVLEKTLPEVVQLFNPVAAHVCVYEIWDCALSEKRNKDNNNRLISHDVRILPLSLGAFPTTSGSCELNFESFR